MRDSIKNTTKIVAIMIGIITGIDYIYGMFYYKIFASNNLNQRNISILMSVGSLSLLIFDFPSGNISDRIGRKKTAGIGIFLWGIGICIFSIANSYYYFLIAIIIFNLGVALESGSLTSWLHTYLVKKASVNLWDKVMADISIYENFVKFFLNGILLILVSFIKFNIIFIASLILIFLGIFIFFWKKDEENYGTGSNIISSIINNFKTIFTNDSIRKLAIIKFLSSIFLTTFLLVYPYKFINQFNFSEELLPYIYFILNFIMFLSSFIYRKFLLNKFTTYKIYKGNILLGMLSILFILISNNLIVFFIGIILFELFFIINIITFGTIQYSYFPEDKKSAMVSALSSVGSLSSSLDFIIIGVFLENQKYLIFLGLIVFICTTLIILLINKLENIKQK